MYIEFLYSGAEMSLFATTTVLVLETHSARGLPGAVSSDHDAERWRSSDAELFVNF
jgi:hypothetical protein